MNVGVFGADCRRISARRIGVQSSGFRVCRAGRWRSGGTARAIAIVTKRVPIPPQTTAATGPIRADIRPARSDVAWSALPTSGAELSYGVGARLPGGAFHQVLWALLKVARDPQWVWRVQVTLSALAALLVGAVAWRRWGVVPGVLAGVTLLAAEPDVATQVRLWNPAWLSLPVAVAAVSGLAVLTPGRDPRAPLLLLGLATGVGSQLHVTAWIVPLGLLVAGWTRARPRAAHVGALLVGLLLPYLPYLVDEARHGWPNTTLLLDPSQRGEGGGLLSADARPGRVAAQLLAQRGGLVGLDAVARGAGNAVWVAVWAAAVALVAGAGAAWRRGVGGASVLVVAALVEVALFVRSKDYGVGGSDNVRYLVAGAPLWALLAGAAARGLLGSGRVGRVALAVALVGAGVRVVSLDGRTSAPLDAALAWSRVVRWHDGVLAATGWSPAELAGRLVVAEREPDGWWRRHATPVDFRTGHAVSDGQVAPACGVVVSVKSADPAPMDGAVVSDVLGAWVSVVSVGPRVDLGPGMAFFPYVTPDGRCPSTLNDRYLPTVEERDTLGLARGRVVDEPGRRVWVVDIPEERRDPWPVRVAVDGRTVRLDASGLRGLAWNEGWFTDHAVWRPRVEVLRPDGTSDTVVLAAGVVGELGALAPLVTPVVTGPGDQLTLVWEALVRDGAGAVVLPPQPGATVRQVLP